MWLALWDNKIEILKIWNDDISAVYLGDEKIWPEASSFALPFKNTLWYRPLNWDLKDYSWNWNDISLSSTPIYGKLNDWSSFLQSAWYTKWSVISLPNFKNIKAFTISFRRAGFKNIYRDQIIFSWAINNEWSGNINGISIYWSWRYNNTITLRLNRVEDHIWWYDNIRVHYAYVFTLWLPIKISTFVNWDYVRTLTRYENVLLWERQVLFWKSYDDVWCHIPISDLCIVWDGLLSDKIKDYYIKTKDKYR